MPLTDTAIRNAKPAGKPYKLADGGGQFLLVNPTGDRTFVAFDGDEHAKPDVEYALASVPTEAPTLQEEAQAPLAEAPPEAPADRAVLLIKTNIDGNDYDRLLAAKRSLSRHMLAAPRGDGDISRLFAETVGA